MSAETLSMTPFEEAPGQPFDDFMAGHPELDDQAIPTAYETLATPDSVQEIVSGGTGKETGWSQTTNQGTDLDRTD